jgi:hypothetical protein
LQEAAVTDIKQLKLKVTLNLDEKWAQNYSSEELLDYLKARLNYSLGFRGQVKKMTTPRQKQPS